ncbi:MAG: peptidoglycan DD-metalloendopeptidase family protein [Oscillospiraceae bacterium]|nr:peptidoglycan DD-metalloendopeptidase family protein [Oscillospiraceae bacterium]
MLELAKNLLENLKGLAKDFLSNKRLIKVVSFVAAGLTAFLVCIASSGATIGYDVNYNGQVIATVKNKQVFTSVSNSIKKRLGKKSKGEIAAPSFKAVVTLKSKLSSKNEVKKAIIDNTDTIAYTSLLRINGENIAYISNGDLEKHLEEYKNSFNIKGSKSVSTFVDDIEVITDYFFTDNVYTIEEAKDIISSIKVQTKATVTSEKEIAFSTNVQYTSAQMLGYSKITKVGKVGKRVTTEDIIYLNGKVVSRVQKSSKVTRNPVSQIKLVGTAKSQASAAQRAEAYASGFIFPIDKNSSWMVSSYWGDGRNHKAVDLACPRGTKIYAVAKGTVTFAGYKSDYGYFVIIDHGNGLSTAYAHASVLGVKTGDRVTAGETIALVGSTGYSTGNHLHFEVQKNGVRIDPAPYIGLDR